MKLKKVVNLFLFTLILGLGVASCSSDDDHKDTPQDNTAVNGIWAFNELTADVETVDSLLTDSVTSYIDSIAVATKRTYTFKADGTYENNSGEEGAEAVKGKYEVSGNKIILDNKTNATVYTFAGDTIRATEDVKAKVATDLQISPDSIMKANKVEVFQRISR